MSSPDQYCQSMCASVVCVCQQALLRTGDEDLCYYNFDCAHPIKNLTAFNNVISNMGYVLLGLLFIILLWRRSEFDLYSHHLICHQ